jgi:hypothetical protein
VNTSLAFSAHQQPGICLHATVGSLPVSQGQPTLAWLRGISFLVLFLLSLLPATLAQNIISTVAGGGPIPSAPLAADIPGPTGTIKDAAGNLYIAAPFSANIYKLSGGVLSLYSGVGWGGFGGDGGPVSAAILGKPTAFAFDSHGNLFIADFGNSRIRKVDAVTQVITTVAGKGEIDPSDMEGTLSSGSSSMRLTSVTGRDSTPAQDTFSRTWGKPARGCFPC